LKAALPGRTVAMIIAQESVRQARMGITGIKKCQNNQNTTRKKE
jgi:hypothetical protein